ncbi:DUF4329 domain-containing protein [Rhodobacteraceae bacterium N5(2021)]|uniref:DUF4329 domain-containing protein n=1 Tax=Gymnodinialimonas phycosphaerae TaxID=2841589 RepID=A0A975TR20_9RHOB|nr:DUF4329 domain-containing protein [Gymnodinialimonas phycosphaerae]MBY4893406.1 DUF4329 domain-containing protein [Gymnodinialimonas phycosphaerae]
MRSMTSVQAALVAAAAVLFAPVAQAQDAREMEFVRGMMESMNQLSVRFNREVCGFILQDDAGNYSSTKASWGGEASCASLPLEAGQRAVSSWHTHAAWGLGYDGEVPSIQDVEGDMRFGVNGWVGTPGGRLWYVDGTTGTMTQACGRDCLPVDPNFYPEEHGPVAETYTLDGLYTRFGRSR